MKKVNSGTEVSSLNFKDFLPEEKKLEFSPLVNYYKYVLIIKPLEDEYHCRIVNFYNDNKIDFEFMYSTDCELEQLEAEISEFVYNKYYIYITGTFLEIDNQLYISHNNMNEINEYYNQKLSFATDKVKLADLRAYDFLKFKLNRYMKYYKINSIMLSA